VLLRVCKTRAKNEALAGRPFSYKVTAERRLLGESRGKQHKFGQSRGAVGREFEDVVFEDVVFHKSSSEVGV